MKYNFSTEDLIKKLKTNAFILNSSMPMGYVPGLPILCILNGNLCMKVPYLKYKVTGEVDKTYVYPVRYVATIIVPEGQIVSFEDLSLNEAFAQVNFSDPVGIFRHEAIKDLDKAAYNSLRKALYGMYDNMVNGLVGDSQFTDEDELKFKRLFNVILEPSLRPFYKAIDMSFSNKYIVG